MVEEQQERSINRRKARRGFTLPLRYRDGLGRQQVRQRVCRGARRQCCQWHSLAAEPAAPEPSTVLAVY